MTSSDRSPHGRLSRLWQGGKRISPIARICICIWILAGLVSTSYLLSQVPDFVRSVRLGGSAQRTAAWGPIEGFAEACAPRLLSPAHLLLVDPTGVMSPYIGYGQPPDVDLGDLGDLQYVVYPSTVTALGHVPADWAPSASPADYIALWERVGYQPSTPSMQQALATAREAESTLRAALPSGQVCEYTDALGNRGVMYAVSAKARRVMIASAHSRLPTAMARILANSPTSSDSWTAYPLTLLGLVSLWLIGMLVLAAVPRRILPVSLTISIALPLGCLAVALELLILSMLRLPWSSLWLALPWLVLAAAVLWNSRLVTGEGIRWSAPWAMLASTWRQLGRDERAVLCVLAALVVGLSIAAPLGLPYTDGMGFNYSKARAFFLDGSTIPYYTRAAAMLYTVPAHPPLIPLSVTWLYLFIGHVDEHATLLLWPALYLSMLVAFYALARGVVSRRCALWCTAGVALIGTNSTQVLKASYADMPLAMYLLLGCGLIWYWAACGRRSQLVLPLAGVLLAAAALTKEEGMPAALLSLAATPLLSMGRGDDGSSAQTRWWIPRAGWWMPYVWAVPAFALSLFPWLLFHFRYPVPENTLYFRGWSAVTLLHRLLIIVADMSARISTRWVAVLALIVVWAIVRWRHGRPFLPGVSGRAWFIVAIVVAQLAVDCVAMDLTLNDVHLETSWAAGRLLEQLIPLAFLGAVGLWPLILGSHREGTTRAVPSIDVRLLSPPSAPERGASQKLEAGTRP